MHAQAFADGIIHQLRAFLQKLELLGVAPQREQGSL
jgi:hypothetical protein